MLLFYIEGSHCRTGLELYIYILCQHLGFPNSRAPFPGSSASTSPQRVSSYMHYSCIEAMPLLKLMTLHQPIHALLFYISSHCRTGVRSYIYILCQHLGLLDSNAPFPGSGASTSSQQDFQLHSLLPPRSQFHHRHPYFVTLP